MAKSATNIHAKNSKSKSGGKGASNVIKERGNPRGKENAKQPAKKRYKKRGIFTMKADIFKRLQKEADFNSISSMAMSDLHSMLRDMTDKLIFASQNLAKREGRTSVNPRDVQAATKFTFHPSSDMSVYACHKGNQYLTKFLGL